MLRDSDPQVVCNCLIVLDEILADEGGVVLTKTLAHYLFGRLKEFGEWSQCLVMRVLARYEASDEEETYDILVRNYTSRLSLINRQRFFRMFWTTG